MSELDRDQMNVMVKSLLLDILEEAATRTPHDIQNELSKGAEILETMGFKIAARTLALNSDHMVRTIAQVIVSVAEGSGDDVFDAILTEATDEMLERARA